jgi:hypothetical protein
MEMDRLREEVGSILAVDWDPIGIQDVPEARGEYDQYVPAITGKLIAGASVSELAASLLNIENRPDGSTG